MLGRAVADALERVPASELWAPEVRDLARSCELVICNLECAISSRGRPTRRVPGKPFFFRAPPVAVESLRAIGVRAVGLANNHALDYEEEALLDTLELLADAKIAVAGAGRDADDARRGIALEAAGLRVGMVAASDHPSEYAAGADVPGIAWADLLHAPEWVVGEVERLKAECDVVVAFLHWGPNMTTQPAGWQLSLADRLAAAGADLVAGHSAHVFHGAGWGEGGPLLYDLGDALDDYAVDAELRNDLGLMAIWQPGDPGALELVGLYLDFCRTELARGADAEWMAARLERACRALGTRVERTAEQRFQILPG